MKDSRAPHPDSQQLARYAAGRLSGRALETVRVHLTDCEECAEVLNAVGDTMAPSGPVPVPAEAEPRRSQAPAAGQMLGEYRILEELGQGGMGVIYRGEHPIIGKQVAIKVMKRAIANDAESIARLIEEARAVNAIRHPNIVDIFAFGNLEDGRPYVVMELLEGLPLSELLEQRGKLTPQQTLEVLSQCFSALEAAHKVGVVHRDLKPENIFVDPRAETWRVTLVDFGLAKRQRRAEEALTQAGMVMGTPAYMAPEQIRGEAVSPATDVYAMGVVAWKLLAGRGPFEGGSMMEVLGRHLRDPAPPLKPEAPDAPAELEALVMQMLSKDPVGRPTTLEVKKRLGQLLPRVTGEHRVAASPSGRGALWLGVGLVLVAVVAASALVVFQSEDTGTRGQLSPIAGGPSEPVRPPPPVTPPPVKPAAPPEVPEAPTPPVTPQPPAAPRLPDEARQWACAKVQKVGSFVTYPNKWMAFQVAFNHDVPLTVTAEPPVDLRLLRKRHKEIQACRGSNRVVTARYVKPLEFYWGASSAGTALLGGVRTNLDAVIVTAPGEIPEEFLRRGAR